MCRHGPILPVHGPTRRATTVRHASTVVAALGEQESVEIRHFVHDDLRAVGRVHALSRRAAYETLVSVSALDTITPETQADYWEDRLERAPRRYGLYVGERAGAVVGFVLGSANGDLATLNAIHVLPELYGTGAGQRLHDRILDDFRDWDCLQAELWVLSGNERAQSFYRRNGWVADGARRSLPMGTDEVPGLRYLLDMTDEDPPGL